MERKIEMIIMDMDSTLLNKQGDIPEKNIQTLRRAQAQGIKVSLASGRMFRSELAAAASLGLSLPLIAYNGAMIRDPLPPQTIRFQKNLEEDQVREVLRRLAPLKTLVQAYLNDELFVERDNELTQKYSKEKNAPYTVVDSFLSLPSLELTKLLVIEKRPFLMDEVRRTLTGIPGVRTELSSRSFCEISSGSADKGTGLKFLCDYLGILPERVVAFGDQENDIPMLQAAGLGIAMGNAPDNVKEMADEVTLHCDEAGVAEALCRLIPGLKS